MIFMIKKFFMSVEKLTKCFLRIPNKKMINASAYKVLLKLRVWSLKIISFKRHA